jgi:enoyl-CoA hydratase/carnithine racemase
MSEVVVGSQLVLLRLELREAGHVAFLTVNNPEKRNALGIAGKKALTEAFKQLARDKALRVAVLLSARKAQGRDTMMRDTVVRDTMERDAIRRLCFISKTRHRVTLYRVTPYRVT